MAKRCGCASEMCACLIEDGDGTIVEGSGSKTAPYRVNVIPATIDMSVQDENVVVATSVSAFDFRGAGVAVTTGDPGEVIVTVATTPPTSYPWDAAWTAYTPTLSGFTVGASTGTGQFTTIGKTIHAHARITLGTGFVLTGPPTITLPVNMKTLGPHNVVLTDTGGNSYVGLGAVAAGSAQAYSIGANGAAVAISASVPFTWTAGDIIDYHITYEKV